MDSGQTTDTRERDKRYAEYGVLGGAVVGMLAGLMYTGPHFGEWSFEKVLAIIFGAIIAGALVGYGMFDFIVIPGVDFITSDDFSHHSGNDYSDGHHHTLGDGDYHSGGSEWHDGGGYY